MQTAIKYTILSPDGFAIYPESYNTLVKAFRQFIMWKARFKAQGYYSSNYGRINLRDLKEECQLTAKINNRFKYSIDGGKPISMTKFVEANTGDLTPIEVDKVNRLQAGESTCIHICKVTRVK